MRYQTVIILLIILKTVTLAEYVSYEGSKVYRIIPKSGTDVYILNLLKGNRDYDIWTETTAMNHRVDIMVAPRAQAKFTSILEKNQVAYAVLIRNVGRSIAMEQARQRVISVSTRNRFSFAQFHRYHKIIQYLERIAFIYKHKMTLRVFGYTSEGRPLYCLKIGAGRKTNPTILIDGGMHGREWMSSATVLYFVSQLVENKHNTEFITKLNWVIVPMLNPDGYEYSHTKDRLWAKTRSRGILCDGVDGNRNFPFQWMGEGASDDECSPHYAGPQAFSEPEMSAFANLTRSIRNLQLYLSIHNFGPWIVYPWEFVHKTREKGSVAGRLGNEFANLIACMNRTRYCQGHGAKVLYFASGNSMDWVHSLGVKLAYCIELPSPNQFGHEHSSRMIIPLSKEVWYGSHIFFNYLISNNVHCQSSMYL